MTSPLVVRSDALANSKLAFTNLAFLHPDDFATVAGDARFVQVHIRNLILLIQPRAEVTKGTLQLNQLQRRSASVSLEEELPLEVVPFGSIQPLSSITLSIDLLAKGKSVAPTKLDVGKVAEKFAHFFAGHVVRRGQDLAMQFDDIPLKLTVLDFSHVELEGTPGGSAGAGDGDSMLGFGSMSKATSVQLEKGAAANITIEGGTRTNKRLFDAGFSFEKLGIGGLNAEFSEIFRRAFASRLYPSLMREMGMNHVRGMLLYGAPGCGKTLIARKIGQALHAKEPKKVNGPEILNKYVGQSEENIRALFKDAEDDQKAHGDDSELHIIIFDEIDAICKQRGSSRDGTGVGDSIVNQLLSKIDGVDSLNNILLIGMTNRKDLIDEALLRPGRLEVHVEIGLPDEAGRKSILQIHTSKAKAAGRLSPEVDFEYLARETKNYTGAELEGLVRDAGSHALIRISDKEDVTRAVDTKSIMLTMEDFQHALDETTPQFGTKESDLHECYRNGIIPYGREFETLTTNIRSFCEQVEVSDRTPLLSLLLVGDAGSGKTAIAAKCAMESSFPFKKRITPDNLVGYSESSKAAAIQKVFEDAYRTPLSIIILDDIERLIDYVPLGQRFSNVVLQTLLVLVKKPPPEGRKMLIMGTTRDPTLLNDMGLLDAFNVSLNCPMVSNEEEIIQVLEAVAKTADRSQFASIARSLAGPVGIKKLLLVLEMAHLSGDVTLASFRTACAMVGVPVRRDIAGAGAPGI